MDYPFLRPSLPWIGTWKHKCWVCQRWFTGLATQNIFCWKRSKVCRGLTQIDLSGNSCPRGELAWSGCGKQPGVVNNSFYSTNAFQPTISLHLDRAKVHPFTIFSAHQCHQCQLLLTNTMETWEWDRLPHRHKATFRTLRWDFVKLVVSQSWRRSSIAACRGSVWFHMCRLFWFGGNYSDCQARQIHILSFLSPLCSTVMMSSKFDVTLVFWIQLKIESQWLLWTGMPIV